MGLSLGEAKDLVIIVNIVALPSAFHRKFLQMEAAIALRTLNSLYRVGENLPTA